MAIQDKKIPKPSDIKSTPQSFSEKELNDIKDLRTQLNQSTLQFGQLYINKLRLEEQEKILKQQLAELESKELNLAKSLSGKYGKGSINLETGTFIPSE